MSKDFDIILFGATGFTGKLTIEHFISKSYNNLRLGVCARASSIEKLQSVVDATAKAYNKDLERWNLPTVLEADLICKTVEQEAKLRAIVKRCRVVLTSAGPFEKYGQTLVKICAEEGVHYADITGETDFFRKMISEHDKVARKNGAIIISHCGNDCIPWDNSVFEMNKYAQNKGKKLVDVKTFTFLPSAFNGALSGGTLTTAVYQLGKSRSGAKDADGFDALLTGSDGEKSKFGFINKSPKSDVYFKEYSKYGGPWIMSPVMTNCVRRSNALLGYSPEFQYSEAHIKDISWGAWLSNKLMTFTIAAAITIPWFQRFLPAPGEGPTREQMEAGWLTVEGHGTMMDTDGNKSTVKTKFHFMEDTGYLCTARMLAETGMLLLEKANGGGEGLEGATGVVTPAVALGSALVERLTKEVPCTFEISEA